MSTQIQRTRVATISVASVGSLVVLSNPYSPGTVTIYQLDDDGCEGRAYYAETKRQQPEGGNAFRKAEFSILPAGNYGVSKPGSSYAAKKATVFPGQVTEIDFR